MSTDQTQAPAARVRTLIRDLFHTLDRLQGAALGITAAPDLTNAIAALKYAHNAIHRAFEELHQ
jgi:hypothetical protein